GNPFAKRKLRDPDQLEDRRSDAPVVFEYAVQHPLDAPRLLAKLGQADHAAAALQRVELAPHAHQRVAVGAIVGKRAVTVVDGSEDLDRFGEVDVEKLGVEAARVGCEEA